MLYPYQMCVIYIYDYTHLNIVCIIYAAFIVFAPLSEVIGMYVYEYDIYDISFILCDTYMYTYMCMNILCSVHL